MSMEKSDSIYSSRIKSLREEKKRIMEKSAELFSKYGYHGVTLDDIAHNLKLNKVTIYHYWHSKQDLYYEILIRINRLITDNIKKTVRQRKPPDVMLYEVVTNYIINLLTHHVPTTENLHKEYALTNKHRNSIIKVRDEFDKLFQQILADGIKKGIFIKGNPKMMEFAIIGVMNYIIHWYSPNGILSCKDIARHMASFIMCSVLISDLRDKYIIS